MGDTFKKLFELSTKLGFLKKIDSQYSFGPLALLLANNIRKEWFQNNVITSDLNVFLYNSQSSDNWQEDCQSSYRHALQVTSDQLPFGLVSFLSNVPPLKCNTEQLKQQLHSPSEDFTNAYRCLIFLSQKDSQQYFYRFQRQRKMWWRKFSTDPERFIIVEDSCQEEGKERIQISAKFPWTTEIIETIRNHGSNHLSTHGSLFEAKVGRKKQLPHVIECVCYESPAVMTYLYDAFQQQPSRNMLRLHPSLAPYKTAFAVDSSDEKAEDLYQLATYLSLTLRRVGLHTLFSPGSRSSKTLDSQFINHDSVGIPYTVVITPDALNNGIIGLRSRDTTLQEYFLKNLKYTTHAYSQKEFQNGHSPVALLPALSKIYKRAMSNQLSNYFEGASPREQTYHVYAADIAMIDIE